MRPGRLTPENGPGLSGLSSPSPGFNEAGAINPGKPRRRMSLRGSPRRFNEAGAISPGKPFDGFKLLARPIWLQ